MTTSTTAAPSPRHAASPYVPELGVRWRGVATASIDPVAAPPLKHSHRAASLVLSVAAAVGLWLGLTAPTVSPVAPAPLPPISTVQQPIAP